MMWGSATQVRSGRGWYRFFEQRLLLGVVHRRAAGRGARARGPRDYADRAAVAHLFDAAAGEVAGTHVPRLLLGPDDLGVLVVAELLVDFTFGPRVELLEPHDGDRRVHLVAAREQL